MLPQMGFKPTFPGLLVGCDDHYTTTSLELRPQTPFYSKFAFLRLKKPWLILFENLKQ